MHRHSPIYYSKLYRDFCSLDVLAPREVVYFYERHEKAISELDFQEYFDILVEYVEALYHCESYESHMLMAEVVIETSICNNIVLHRGEDIYQKMLFRKACSHYHLGAFRRSGVILRQLCRMRPETVSYKKMLARSGRMEIGETMQNVRAATIFCFLLATLVTLAEVLVIRNFYADFQQTTEYTRLGLFSAGILGLLYRYVDMYRSQVIEWEDFAVVSDNHSNPDNRF